MSKKIKIFLILIPEIVFLVIFSFFIFKKESLVDYKLPSLENKSALNTSVTKDGALIAKESPKEATIIFGGDVMLDRYIRQVGESKGFDYILNDLKEKLIQSDLVVANLEGPLTENPSISKNSKFGSRENYIFTFEPTVVNFLEKFNFKIVNIGNNHIDNFGNEGIATTKNFLEKSQIGYFGNTSSADNLRYLIKDLNGIQIAFVNYNQFAKNSLANTLADIASVKNKSDFIVIYTHWGIEYETEANQKEVELAHKFIDSGADLIIGSHPHVIQNKEIYQGKNIYYSLGNFIFDQYFSPETTQGLLIKANFDKENQEITLNECSIKMITSGKVTFNEKDCF